MKPHIYKIIFFLFVIILNHTACKHEEATVKNDVIETQDTENTVALTTAQYKNAQITTTTLQAQAIKSTIQLNGKIDVPPQNILSVSTYMGGYLTNTPLLPGMHVKKGELIATLEDPQYIQLQQDYLLAKSKLHFAQLEYNRQRQLNQNQASSDKVTQQAEAEVMAQRITMNALAEKLKLININPEQISESNITKTIQLHSSITGFVSKINVNLGKYVSPTDAMFELINPTDIHLNLKVFERDIPQLAIGQKVIAYNNANPEKKYTCEIILISKDISPEGTTDVHCHFKGKQPNLIPGMYMNAEVEISSNSANVLPEESVVTFEGKEYVFIENSPQDYQMLEVKVGTKQNGQISIEDNPTLKNKTIVTSGAYTLLMKMKNTSE